MTTLIGITGYRRSGKDSIADILMQEFAFVRCAFADPLRQMSSSINPMISLKGAPYEILESFSFDTAARYNDLLERVGYHRAKEVPDFRNFLQKLGTEGVRRHLGDDAWVRAMELFLVKSALPKVVVSDVRFHNEADFIWKSGGSMYRVIRPGIGGDDPHPSEIDVPNLEVHREIHNTGTLEDLRKTVLHIMYCDHKGYDE